jgi:hypothetical protein
MRGWLNRASQQRPVRPHRKIGKFWFMGRPSMTLERAIINLGDDSFSLQPLSSVSCVSAPVTQRPAVGTSRVRSSSCSGLQPVNYAAPLQLKTQSLIRKEVWGWELRKTEWHHDA